MSSEADETMPTAHLVAGGARAAPRGRRTRATFAQRLASSRRLFGYSSGDESRVRATHEVVLSRASEIADAFYDRLLSHPETAVYFTRSDGAPDRAHLAMRRYALIGWLHMLIESPIDDGLGDRLALIGRAHTGRGGDPAVHVKGRYLVEAMSTIQTAIARVLDDGIEDRSELAEAIASWNKVLMIHLDVFLAVYGSAEGNAHWY